MAMIPKILGFKDFLIKEDTVLLEAGYEQQEHALIAGIDKALRLNDDKPIKIKDQSGRVIFQNVTGAEKESSRTISGKENYTDVNIFGQPRGKVSMKDVSAPSMAGGGLAGLMAIDSDLTQKTWDRAIKYISGLPGIKHGSVVSTEAVPDLSIEIPQDLMLKVIKGVPSIGGPISHIYQGPMNLTGQYDKASATLTVNGVFMTPEEYLKKAKQLYIVIRKRDIRDNTPKGKMKIDLKGDSKNNEGLSVLMKDPKTNKNNSRVLVADYIRGKVI